MLEARPAKRDATNRFKRDVRYEIYAAGAKVGALVYDAKSESATLDVRGQAFSAAREHARRREVPWQFLWRKLSGGQKRPAGSSRAAMRRSNCAGDRSSPGSTISIARGRAKL
jgi:hypothetical protein